MDLSLISTYARERNLLPLFHTGEPRGASAAPCVAAAAARRRLRAPACCIATEPGMSFNRILLRGAVLSGFSGISFNS